MATDSEKITPICAKIVPKRPECFVNSFEKIPPISARYLLKLPEMSLFEPRKKSKKRIEISKLAKSKLVFQSVLSSRLDQSQKHEAME